MRKHVKMLFMGYVVALILLSVVSISGNNSFRKTHWAGLRADYIIHATFFLPWMTLANFKWNPLNRSKIYWIILGIGLILAAVSEFVQLIVPYKTFNPIDMAANGLGACIGAVVPLLFASAVEKRQE